VCRLLTRPARAASVAVSTLKFVVWDLLHAQVLSMMHKRPPMDVPAQARSILRGCICKAGASSTDLRR
jgi:hypothetical protein